MSERRPILALTQGDPAGVGPELLLRLTAAPRPGFRALLVGERAAFDRAREALGGAGPDLVYLTSPPSRSRLDALDAAAVAVLDPVGEPRTVQPGRSGPADAAGALAALDAGIELASAGVADALVTAPVAKDSIARHCDPAFRGHTDHLARACGLERYGRDYLMAFLAPDLQVALLSTHLPLRRAIDAVATEPLVEALACLDRHAGGSIAVAGLNPHAGEGGLMGSEEEERITPAVAAAQRRGIDARGPESPDSLFARARGGEFDWVLALYHDQGLIAVKTAAFGTATNWTVGLPFLRTSVDHGTAFDIAGQGRADARPLAAAVDATLALIRGTLPRRRQAP